MEHTENLQLSQWEASDRIQRQDFNSDNAKLDAAFAGQAAALALKGNCQLYSYSYTGDGQCGQSYRKVLQFPWQPDLILVVTTFGYLVPLVRGLNYSRYVGSNITDNVYAAWSGNTVQITTNNYSQPNGFLNNNGMTYYVFAFRALG